MEWQKVKTVGWGGGLLGGAVRRVCLAHPLVGASVAEFLACVCTRR